MNQARFNIYKKLKPIRERASDYRQAIKEAMSLGGKQVLVKMLGKIEAQARKVHKELDEYDRKSLR